MSDNYPVMILFTVLKNFKYPDEKKASHSICSRIARCC